MTSPVSQKITAKSAPYAKTPRSANSASRRSSTWSAKSRSDARKEASAAPPPTTPPPLRAGERGGGGDGRHRRRGDATETREGDGTASACRSRSVERARSAIRRVVRRFQGTVRARNVVTGAPKPTLLDRASRPGRAASPARRVGAAPKNARPSRSPRALATARGNGPARVPRHRDPRRVGRGTPTADAPLVSPTPSLLTILSVFHASPPTSALSTREATTMSRARLRAGQPTRDDRSTARADGWLGVSSRATR